MTSRSAVTGGTGGADSEGGIMMDSYALFMSISMSSSACSFASPVALLEPVDQARVTKVMTSHYNATNLTVDDGSVCTQTLPMTRSQLVEQLQQVQLYQP